MASSLSDILATIQQGVIALNKLGQQVKGSFTAISGRLTGYESSWTPYTPVITSQFGAFTTVSATGRFKQNGKTVFVSMVITITTNGTASGVIFGTLPFLAGIGQYILAGRENAVAGNMLQGFISATSTAVILNYNNTYAGGDGFVLALSGVYETA